MAYSKIIKNGIKFTLAEATPKDCALIYRYRHDVYAEEIKQHHVNAEREIKDRLDEMNVYIVAKANDEIAGFISITSPESGIYSLDKYFSRDVYPFKLDDDSFEVRLLTVREQYRGQSLSGLLMYAAFRMIQEKGGKRMLAMGRKEVMGLYKSIGMKPLGPKATSGNVTFKLMSAEIAVVHRRLSRFQKPLNQLKKKCLWMLPFTYIKTDACFHGGAFFDEGIGNRFETLDKREKIINADVLDAWFDPSPKVTAKLGQHMAWILKTSPPTNCSGLIQTIAEKRGVSPENILLGAGSSDLIFRVFTNWLSPKSKVLVIDPCYGEYTHYFESVVKCHIDYIPSVKGDKYKLDLAALSKKLKKKYDLVVLINPTNPTGQHIRREVLEPILEKAHKKSKIWVDEAYLDYMGADQSLEKFAAERENIIVCKSMSKVYALSGTRVAYLCPSALSLNPMRKITPPWVVSLPAQIAAVEALKDESYYLNKYTETHKLRKNLCSMLQQIPELKVMPSDVNFVLCELPSRGPKSEEIVKACRQHNLFIRNVANMGRYIGKHTFRIAVKDEKTNRQITQILYEVLTHQAYPPLDCKQNKLELIKA